MLLRFFFEKRLCSRRKSQVARRTATAADLFLQRSAGNTERVVSSSSPNYLTSRRSFFVFCLPRAAVPLSPFDTLENKKQKKIGPIISELSMKGIGRRVLLYRIRKLLPERKREKERGWSRRSTDAYQSVVN